MKFSGWIKQSLMDYPGKIATVLFTQGCNFKCPYCHNPELIVKGEGEIDEEDVFKYVEKFKCLLDGVVITGGEPTMHPELIGFIKKIKSIGLMVKLDTNGTNPSFLSELFLNNTVDYVAMDIKSQLTELAYSMNSGVNATQKLIENIRKSIKLIVKSGIEHEFRTTVCRELNSIDNIISIMPDIKGAKKYFIQRYRDFYGNDCNKKKFSAYSVEEMKCLADKINGKISVCVRE